MVWCFEKKKKVINSVIGVRWRLTDVKWTVDRPGVRLDTVQIPPFSFEGARIQRESITKQDTDEFGAPIGCPGKQEGRSLQKANRRMPQNHSTWIRKIGLKK